MPNLQHKVTVGICAMDKKAKSKAMSAILQRLEKYGEFEIIIFGDDCILHRPIEEWPKVETLISFFSDRFPLDKAEAYVKLHQPYVVNNLEQQWDLLDRRIVYRTLMENDIPVPPHILVERNTTAERGTMPDHGVKFDAEDFVEAEDYVEIGGKRINKPFVEKPADAENHNICIYYPHTVGGGYKAGGDKSLGRRTLHPHAPFVLIHDNACATARDDVSVFDLRRLERDKALARGTVSQGGQSGV